MTAVSPKVSTRITVTISSLTRGGGAEKVASVLINSWAKRGHPVTAITLYSVPSDEQSIDPAVQRANLGADDSAGGGLARGVFGRIGRLAEFRRQIVSSRPDVIISVMDRVNVLTLLATAGLKIPTIVCEHTDPNVHKITWTWSLLRRLLYPRARAVVVLTEDASRWAKKIVPAPRVHVIPNPAEAPASSHAGNGGSATRTVIAMGRLIPLKRFDLLLEAFSRCTGAHPDWSLTILGDGPERESLLMSIERLGLSGRVSMPGRVEEPQDYLARADLFAMSSDYEGFPMSLLEAMASGLPVVSTDCPSGPRAMIRDGIDGLLVPPGRAGPLAEALDRLMSDDAQRVEFGRRAAEVIDRFGVEKVMSMWDAVIDESCK